MATSHPSPRRRSLLVDRNHTMRPDGTPRCGWDNVPDGARPQRLADLPYCGACVLVDLHQERLHPDHDPLPWTTMAPAGCARPDLMPWEALALLQSTRWAGVFDLADLQPWVDEHRWWFERTHDQAGAGST